MINKPSEIQLLSKSGIYFLTDIQMLLHLGSPRQIKENQKGCFSFNSIICTGIKPMSLILKDNLKKQLLNFLVQNKYQKIWLLEWINMGLGKII